MPHSEAQAWWADVQHVRESIERRRARGLDSSAFEDAATEHRFARPAAESLPPLDDFDWSPGATGQSTGRFDRTQRQQRGEHGGPRARRTGAERRRGDWLDAATDAAAGTAGPLSAATPITAQPGAPLSPEPARRTVQITGRGVTAPSLPRLVEVARR